MTVLDMIGGTRMIPLQHMVPADSARILVKLEYENPTGSMKDRMALATRSRRYRHRKRWRRPAALPGKKRSSRARPRARTWRWRCGSQNASALTKRWSRWPLIQG
jgi:hypothetical protein